MNVFFSILPEKLEIELWNALSTAYLSLLFFRGVTQLRAIDSMRYLIAMLQRVFIDMIPFFTVLAAAIVSLAIVELQLGKAEGQFDGDLLELFQAVNRVYDIGYGNWDGTGELRVFRYISFFFSSILFPLVMFNLLIAIISSTYEEFENGKELKDLQELFEMLGDMGAVV